MENRDAAIAIFANHHDAEIAVKKLTSAGFDMKNLSVVGKGYHSDEKVIGFYNTDDRIKFWGTRGLFWGGLWGLFFGGLFLITPFGPIVALGYFATVVIAAAENAALVGGLSALGAALYSIGIPKDSIIQYEAHLKADDFMVMAHGTAEEVIHAKTILGTANTSRLDTHTFTYPADPLEQGQQANR